MPDPLPKYRFLPWTRRGLAASILQTDTGGDLAARARLPVAITVTGLTPAGVDLEVYGPGDVIGVDQRLIVRTEPRPNVTDFEPNYFAAIEFDLPDFPWMFTPARAGAQERLRPWCVLVVLDERVVEPPKVNRGAPLPVVTIPAEVSATELPDLAESWVWAHAQVMSDSMLVSELQQELASQPDLNVSRLVCPRRLVPNQRYLACLVPAFDLGVQCGLGLTPNGASAKPAWEGANPGEVKLPLYFHWEFATGPAGDFESLARKLTPTKAPAETGFQRMFVGAAGGGLVRTPASSEASYLKMEGVLRAPNASNSALADVPAPMRSGLQEAINAPSATASGASTQSVPISPPIYGEWHLNLHNVQDAAGDPEWLRELNLDPRSRAAAGLGAEVVRANQEDFMQAAWEQVGDVIKANELLNRGRFSVDVHRRTYERHYTELPHDRLLQLTAPLHARTLLADKTVRAQITLSSLPNASVDPALRRLTSPQRAWLKSVARRGNFAGAGSRSVRSTLLASLADNKVAVDPTQFMPDGLIGTALLDEVEAASGTTEVDLSPLGIQAHLEINRFNRMRSIRAGLIKIKPQDVPKMTMRPDLEDRGVILDEHATRIRGLQAQAMASAMAGLNLHTALNSLSDQAKQDPSAAAFLVSAEPDAPAPIGALRVDASGNVLLRTRPGEAGTPVARLGTDIQDRSKSALARVLDDLPIGSLESKRIAGLSPPVINRGEGGRITITRADPPGALPRSVTLLPPNTDRAVVTRFKQGFSRMAQATKLDLPDPLAAFVAFDVGAARDTLVARLNPDVTVLRRLRTMISGEAGLALEDILGLTVLPLSDRVMAAPEIAAPMYSYFAKYDRERFLPGIGQLAPDSITLLETNTRFIEALMIGLNYEMSRELLWREYPTDQRGTPIRRFWNWADGGPDLLQPIHRFLTDGLGLHVRGGSQGGQTVLLLRGQLLRRYPNTIIYAWRAKDAALKDPPDPGDIREPAFRGTFDPDVGFAGFDLRDSDLTQGDGWFFVLQEQPTEPRFGFDETSSTPADTLSSWSEASWLHAQVQPGRHLLIQGNPLNGKVMGGVDFGKNSAHLAYITLQTPMRVAIHGKHMVE